MSNLVKEKVSNFAIYSRPVNAALVLGLVFCLGLYIYFANMAVRTLSLSEKLKDNRDELSLKVSELESKRLAVDQSVGNALAQSLGFVEVKDQIFIIQRASKALSFNGR